MIGASCSLWARKNKYIKPIVCHYYHLDCSRSLSCRDLRVIDVSRIIPVCSNFIMWELMTLQYNIYETRLLLGIKLISVNTIYYVSANAECGLMPQNMKKQQQYRDDKTRSSQTKQDREQRKNMNLSQKENMRSGASDV